MKFLLLSVVLALGSSYSAHAQGEVTLIAPGSIGAAIEQLIPDFERKTGIKVKATLMGSSGEIKRQVARGAAFDVPIVPPPYPDVLASGNVVDSSATELASVAVGVAVRQGAAKPDISTAEAVKQMLLAARSISYPDAARGAAAGVSLNETLKKLGIAERIQPKIKPAPRRGLMALVAKGEVDIGLTFLSEMNQPGIEVVGPLPREISTPTTLVGFVSSHAKDSGAAKTLLDYLSSPDAAAAYKAHGMQPAR